MRLRRDGKPTPSFFRWIDATCDGMVRLRGERQLNDAARDNRWTRRAQKQIARDELREEFEREVQQEVAALSRPHWEFKDGMGME